MQSLLVPPRVFDIARETLGNYFEPISKMEPEANASDFLNAERSIVRAKLLERYVTLGGSKMLEIGSGFGINVAVWQKQLNVDAYGVEPGSDGFEGGFEASQLLLAANDIDPQRIVRASGEALPFPDESFDIVYSANVLEHTKDPEAVMFEAFRVLRLGGTLHFEIPNHLSYFEGHYLLLQPPLIDRRILPVWVAMMGRDPSFAKTLHTEINPIWCRRVVKALAKRFDVRLVSLGEEVFLERLAKPFVFEAKEVSGRLGLLLRVLQKVNFGNWIGRMIVALKGHYPLYLTLKKG